jgi:hypothetical protein
MSNLRSENFGEIEAVYADIKKLIQQCKRLGETIITSGLQKVNLAIRRMVNYQAINQEYWNYIGGAATALNCLLNLHGWRLCKVIKETLTSLFNRLSAILPDSFQLNLFDAAGEFGWERTPPEEVSTPKTNSPWYKFIRKLASGKAPQWLTKVLKRDWVSHPQGKQLSLATALGNNP